LHTFTAVVFTSFVFCAPLPRARRTTATRSCNDKRGSNTASPPGQQSGKLCVCDRSRGPQPLRCIWQARLCGFRVAGGDHWLCGCTAYQVGELLGYDQSQAMAAAVHQSANEMIAQVLIIPGLGSNSLAPPRVVAIGGRAEYRKPHAAFSIAGEGCARED